uniref:Uncharacterized protein n=1 Tax=Magallana gigas TaxID=29159 RepID=K1R116_MAGGI
MFSLLLTQSVPVPYKSEPLSGEEEQTGSERKHRDDPEIYGREAASSPLAWNGKTEEEHPSRPPVPARYGSHAAINNARSRPLQHFRQPESSTWGFNGDQKHGAHVTGASSNYSRCRLIASSNQNEERGNDQEFANGENSLQV